MEQRVKIKKIIDMQIELDSGNRMFITILDTKNHKKELWFSDTIVFFKNNYLIWFCENEEDKNYKKEYDLIKRGNN